ncbi:hypothetical protein D9M71_367580 [compost metagenome]
MFQYAHIVDQGKAVLEHRQFTEPALNSGDFPFQAHQLLGAAALVVLQGVLFAAIVLGLDHQLFLTGAGIVLPGAEQRVEQGRQAVQLAAQDVALLDAIGQCLDQWAGGHQRVVILFHPSYVTERFFAGGNVVDAA